MAVSRFPIEHGSIQYGSRVDVVPNRSLHRVLKTTRKLLVKGDFQKQYKKKFCPYAKLVQSRSGDLREDKPVVSRNNNDETCNKVEKILALYRGILYKLERENEKSVGGVANIRQVAASRLKEHVSFVKPEKRIGHVQGIEIGDQFESRVELCITGLHLQHINGIDCMLKDGTLLATSVVDSSRYSNVLNKYGDLIYVGEGGNPAVGNYCRLKNQVMKRGNLALVNSKDQRMPVRVIRKCGSRKTASYVYDGLYKVMNWWVAKGPHNKYVYKFQLRRLPKQPKNPRGYPCKSREYLSRKYGLTNKYSSGGKEKFPIGIVN